MDNSDALVLFDIDGTLLKGSGPYHQDALRAGILRVTGVHANTEGIPLAGTLDHDLITLMLQNKQVSDDVIARALPQIVESCEAAFLANCADDLRSRVCPGVVDLLARLNRAGVTLGVVTGNLRVIGWRKLEAAGLRDYFVVGAFSQDGSTRAAIALKAAERAADLAINATRRFTRISLIGDHRNDIVAAKANKFRAIAVATGALSEQELWSYEPDLVVKDLTGLASEEVLQARNDSSVETCSGERR